MQNEDDRDRLLRFSLPRTSVSDLRGRQSVRATFKLTEKAIGVLSLVSIHLGVQQKSLFDHLMEDAETLQAIAHGIKGGEFKRRDSVQKTYVLSRKALSSLDRASKSFNAPRDALVEYSIHRLLPVIEREKKRHLKRKKVLGELAGLLRDAVKLLNETGAELGEDDPVYDRMETAARALEGAYNDIDAFVEKGKVIEEF